MFNVLVYYAHMCVLYIDDEHSKKFIEVWRGLWEETSVIPTVGSGAGPDNTDTISSTPSVVENLGISQPALESEDR